MQWLDADLFILHEKKSENGSHKWILVFLFTFFLVSLVCLHSLLVYLLYLKHRVCDNVDGMSDKSIWRRFLISSYKYSELTIPFLFSCLLMTFRHYCVQIRMHIFPYSLKNATTVLKLSYKCPFLKDHISSKNAFLLHHPFFNTRFFRFFFEGHKRKNSLYA